jgi:hypothetical protein
MEFGVAQVEHALRSLGALLAARGEGCAVAVIGGSALLLLGYGERATQDVDVVGLVRDGAVVATEAFPGPVAAAIGDVGDALGIGSHWLNLGPASLVDLGLPIGFVERAVARTYDALTVLIADRLDQIHFKLYAAADAGPRSKHYADLRRLDPSSDELRMASAWCLTHDPSPGFASELAAVVTALGESDG